MKRVLIVKTSSLGDVIHSLPALTDAVRHCPEIRFDWVVEESFQEIPTWHPAVDRVIPIALRRWRKTPLKSLLQTREWQSFLRALRAKTYDMIIDAQGLLKSAWITRMSHGPTAGLSFQSAREPLASFFYQHKYAIAKDQHAITRVRQLFAAALGYREQLAGMPLDFGLQQIHQLPIQQLREGNDDNNSNPNNPYVLFLHGTTWQSKLWPTAHWITLGRWLNHRGYTVYLPWGNSEEEKRAQMIATKLTRVIVLPKLPLQSIARYLQEAALVIALDSGLTHLAGALGVPTIALFGSTNVEKTGPKGKTTVLLKSNLSCSPCLKKECRFAESSVREALCMQALSPTQIWQQCLPYLPVLQEVMTEKAMSEKTMPEIEQ